MPLKPVSDPNKIKELESSTKAPKLKPVSDPEVLKALENPSGTGGSFIKGFTHSFDEYAASFNKLAQKITDTFVPDEYNTHFFEKNAKWWNKQKHLNELETAKHPYSKLAGEILLDPLNFTPAGIATKGAKAARIAKSVAGGAAVGAGTMAFKNYGDQSKSTERKQEEVATGAAIGAIVNGVIAALTKGKIKNVIKDETNPEEAKKVLQALADNPEAFGLTKQQAEQAGKAAMSVHHKHNPEEAKQFWREVINPNDTGYRQDWRYAVPEGQHPAKADMEVQPITTPRPAGLLEHKSIALENKDVIYQGWDKEGILPPPHYPIERTRPGAIESEAAPSIPREKPQIEAGPQQETRTGPKSVEYENITDDPLFYYALDLARNRSWKDKRYDKRIAVERNGVDTQDGGHINWGQVTEPNYEYDFSLTKSDVKKIEKALEKGEPIPEDLMEKVKSDIGVLENHPNWRDEAQAIRHEAETLFTNGTPRLAAGFAGGTINTFSNADQNDDGIITLDEAALAFGKGFLGGALAGHLAAKYGDDVVDTLKVLKGGYDAGFTRRGKLLYPSPSDTDSASRLSIATKVGARINAVRRVRRAIERAVSGGRGERVLQKTQEGKLNFIPELQQALNKAEIDTPNIIDLSKRHDGVQIFYDAIVKAKEQGLKAGKPEYAQVYVYPPEEYKNMRLLLTEDGKAGVAVKPDGDIVSVFRSPDAKHKRIAHYLLLMALAHGGKKLDAFNTFLPKIYAEAGFRPVAKQRWLDEYAPNNWSKERLGTPDVVYETYDPKFIGIYNDKAPYVDSWEDAIKAQNSALNEENGIKIGAFGGSDIGDKGGKEFAPHLKKIFYERLNKEWSDISKSIKGEFRRLLTNTFSGEYLAKRDAFTAAKNEVITKADILHNVLKELPEKDRQLLHEYIVGDVKPEQVPEEIRRVGENMRATVKEMTDQLVKEGILSEGAVKEWGEYYLRRAYKKHALKDILHATSSKKTLEKLYERGNIVKLKDDDIEALQEFLEPLGVDVSEYASVSEFAKDNAHLLERPLREGGIRIRQAPGGKLELKRDWTYEERTKMEEIRDAAVTVPQTILKLGTLVEHARFLKDVAKTDGAILTKEMAEKYQPSELDAMGYVKLPKSPRYGALSDMWVRKDVRDDIDAIGDHFIDAMLGEKSLIKEAWDGYLRLWKKSKTVWNAPAHVNNFLSNLFLMHLAGLKTTDIVKRLADSTKLITLGGKYKELAKKAMLGTATKEELDTLKSMEKELKYYLEAENLGLLNQSQLIDILKGETKDYGKVGGALQKLDVATSRAYQLEDEVNRLATYITLRERGWSKEEARQGVEVIMPDYTQPMPKFWRWAKDTGISPFIAWNYYTVPKILRLVQTKEGATRAAIALGALYGLSYVLTGMSPKEHIPGIDTNMPEWAKGRYIPIARDGNKVTMIKADRWLPYLQMLHPINYAKDLASGVTTDFMVSTLTGNKLYNNRPITNPKKSLGLQAYDYAKHYIGNYVPVPQELISAASLAESALIDKNKRRVTKTVEPRTPAQNALKLLGLNTLTYNRSALKREQAKGKGR